MPFRPTAMLAGLALAVLLALPVQAQQRGGAARADGPQQLGAFNAWTAATLAENGQRVCYAFARAARSQGAPGGRGTVTLTVAHRPNGRDQVALSAGYALARNATSELEVGEAKHRSYGVVQSSAFFADGAELVSAFRRGREAVARTPGPNARGTVTDTFPLSGFSAAYDAITRACPARPAR